MVLNVLFVFQFVKYDIYMDYSWIDCHASEYASTLNGRLFAGVSCNRESINRTSSTDDGMVLTLVISGNGIIQVGNVQYEIIPGTILFRHKRMDYKLSLSSQVFHRRCYIVIPDELFAIYLQLHPNLLKVPAVQSAMNIKKCFDSFLLVLKHIKETCDETFFSLLPVVERYMLYVLSPYTMEGKAASLREAKARLEVDFSTSLEEIANNHSMSYSTFRKAFSENYGLPPQQYRLRCRVEKAKQLLSMGYNCAECADKLSYPDQYSFSHQFKLIAGVTPKEYRKEHIL